MKAIIFFVAFGRPLAEDIDAAKTIADHANERVVFRNGSLAAQNSEAPEPCLGYAGIVPESEAYQTKPTYTINEDGEVETVEPGDGIVKFEQEAEVNEIGLPIGSPDNRDDLKAALDEAEVEYHGNAKTNVLVALYLSEVLVAEED
jgi:hypothetical protein